MEQAEVAVIGAGPIGLETAVALRRAGVPFVHLEAGAIGATMGWWAPGTRYFSSPERMRWDAAAQVWTSEWCWRPPVNAPVDATYTLNCSLGDGIVANMVPVPSVQTVVKVVPPGTLAWIHHNGNQVCVR